MGTTQSILRKTLMESGLGESVTGGGLSDELLQATYSVGLKGIKPENVDQVEKLIVDTLGKVVKEGFTDENIASSMNTIEFQVRVLEMDDILFCPRSCSNDLFFID